MSADGIKVQYTPKQLMEAAQFYERNEERVRRVVQSNNVLANIHETIPMLKYAAEVIKRANERRGTFAANYGRIDYETDSAIVDEIDYVLRGNAGKGAE